jgi:hypothetical protein
VSKHLVQVSKWTASSKGIEPSIDPMLLLSALLAGLVAAAAGVVATGLVEVSMAVISIGNDKSKRCRCRDEGESEPMAAAGAGAALEEEFGDDHPTDSSHGTTAKGWTLGWLKGDR